MNTVRRLIYSEVIYAIAFVSLGFLALFFFFDLVDELPALGKHGLLDYQLSHALLYSALLIPNHLYELLPIAVLIGCVYVLARLAKSSEFTILRTSGLGPWRALGMLLKLGLIFVALTFVVGDYLAPPADRLAQLVKARYQGRITVGQTGAWLKEKRDGATAAVNVRSLLPDGSMGIVRVFEFDDNGRLVATVQAEKARFGPPGHWTLEDAESMRFTNATSATPSITRDSVGTLVWPTTLTAEMIASALINPARMSTVDLFVYQRHLQANQQTAQQYEIAFWRKVFYPLSCLVMVVLALPFAYLHFRSGGITGYVFGGVMAGISFVLLNNVFGFIGNLQNWLPWLTAAAPSMLYTMISLAAFGWLVLRR